jgi:hypothetical protein
MPITSNNTDRTVNEGATPSKLIETAVMAGVRIMKYRAAVRSAIIPINGFNNHGIR